MSGGHFEYQQYRMKEIAEQLEKDISDIESNNQEERGEGFPWFKVDNEILSELKKGLNYLKLAYVYAQRIDWLMSGDDGENSFKERLKEELEKLENGRT